MDDSSGGKKGGADEGSGSRLRSISEQRVVPEPAWPQAEYELPATSREEFSSTPAYDRTAGDGPGNCGRPLPSPVQPLGGLMGSHGQAVQRQNMSPGRADYLEPLPHLTSVRTRGLRLPPMADQAPFPIATPVPNTGEAPARSLEAPVASRLCQLTEEFEEVASVQRTGNMKEEEEEEDDGGDSLPHNAFVSGSLASGTEVGIGGSLKGREGMLQRQSTNPRLGDGMRQPSLRGRAGMLQRQPTSPGLTDDMHQTSFRARGGTLRRPPPSPRLGDDMRQTAFSVRGEMQPPSPRLPDDMRQTSAILKTVTMQDTRVNRIASGIKRQDIDQGGASRSLNMQESEGLGAASHKSAPAMSATMRLHTASAVQPIKMKLKVTDELMVAIHDRLAAKQPKRTMSPRLRGRNSTISATKWGLGGQRTMGVQQKLQQEVDCFIELVCGDVTKRDSNLVQRGPPKPWYIASPNSVNRIKWDLFIVVVLTWSAFTIPYRVAFDLTDSNESTGAYYWDILMDTVYLIDVVINFFTGYMEENVTVIDPKLIARQYLTTWFALDFLSSLPLDHVSGIGAWSNIIRLCKVLRFMRYAAYIEAKANAMYISATLVRLGTLVIFIIWFWHMVACGYWYLSSHTAEGSAWALPDADPSPSGMWLNYLRSLEWALQTTFSYAATSPAETLAHAYFDIVAVVGGVIMTSVIIGSASSALQSLDAETEARRQRMDKVMAYLKRRKIPKYFQKVVLDYYSYMSDRLSQDSIIQELPQTIQTRLSLLLNRDLLKFVPALRMLDLNAVVSLMQSLYSKVFLPGEYVFKAGDAGLHLFFIKTGVCEMILADGKTVAGVLIMGDIAGAVALLNHGNHDFSVRVSAFSEVLFMGKEAYEELVIEADRFAEFVETEAIKQEQLVCTALANLQRYNKLTRIQTDSEKDLRLKDMIDGSTARPKILTQVINAFGGETTRKDEKWNPSTSRGRVAPTGMADEDSDHDRDGACDGGMA